MRANALPDVTHCCEKCGCGYVFVNPENHDPRCLMATRGGVCYCNGRVVSLPQPVKNDEGVRDYRTYLRGNGSVSSNE